jgi:predicted nicotinamide N-methyase
MSLIWPDFHWQHALDDANKAGDERPTWAYNWPAGQRLDRLLPELISTAPQRLIDLGCGRGLLGLHALQRWPQCHVTFCDQSKAVLQFVTATAATNNFAARCDTLLHTWGEPLPKADLIVGGDILYRPECHAALLKSIRSSNAALCLLGDPREELEQQLPSLAAQAGLTYQHTFHEDIRCSVVHLQPTEEN